MDYSITAKELIQKLGGGKNISSLTHCMTRLRFILNDESIVDDSAVSEILLRYPLWSHLYFRLYSPEPQEMNPYLKKPENNYRKYKKQGMMQPCFVLSIVFNIRQSKLRP